MSIETLQKANLSKASEQILVMELRQNQAILLSGALQVATEAMVNGACTIINLGDGKEAKLETRIDPKPPYKTWVKLTLATVEKEETSQGS